MKRLLQVYGTIMLPVLAVVNEFKKKEVEEERVEFEIMKESKEKKTDPWDWFFKDIIPLEVREERLIENE